MAIHSTGNDSCLLEPAECADTLPIVYVMLSFVARSESHRDALLLANLSLISVKSSLYPVFIISNDILCKLYTN